MPEENDICCPILMLAAAVSKQSGEGGAAVSAEDYHNFGRCLKEQCAWWIQFESKPETPAPKPGICSLKSRGLGVTLS